MPTPNDNSNITDQQVFDAKESLRTAKNQRATLVKEQKAAKTYLDNTANKTAAFPPGYGSTYSDGTLKFILSWSNPTNVADVPYNPPKRYTFNDAEYAVWQTGNPRSTPPKTIWVQPYLTIYGTEWLPSFMAINSLFYTATNTTGAQPGGKNNFILTDEQVSYWIQQDIYNKKTAAIIAKDKLIAQYQAIIDKGPEISLLNTDGTLSIRNFIGLVYNVGSVQEAYFSSKNDFLNELTKLSKVNTPSAVTNAMQLWSNGSPNKGMIQPYTQLQQQNAGMPAEVKVPSSSSEYNAIAKKFPPTGFQFLYNPASVDMTYAGLLGVDPNFETNGLDQFNPLGVYTQATINFNILINRMFDFKYYDKKTGLIAKEYKNNKPLYYPREPEEDEQKDIYKKGTMYDLEHLLRAVLGFGMPSYLGRNMRDGMTADLGFITGIPVELHLGSNMRYLGNVTQLNVSHVLFDERMVPIFTNLAISFARLVDPTGVFQSAKSWDAPDNGKNYRDAKDRPGWGR